MIRMLILVCLVWCCGVSPATAQSEMRQWSDKTGKFKIDAKFVEVKGGKVVLTKSDGKKLEIPLDKLSDDDQSFIKGLNGTPTPDPEPAADNPFESGAQLPPKGKKKGDAWMAPDFVKLRRVPGLSKKDKNTWHLDPVSSVTELAESVQLPKMTFHERINGSAISSNGLWLAFSIIDPFAGSRLHLMNLKEGQLVATMEIPKPEDNKSSKPVLLAVSPDGKYVFTGSEHNSWDRVAAMKTKLWKVVGEELKPAMEWSPFDTGATQWHEQDKSRVTWGGFAEPSKLLMQANGYVVQWDLLTGKAKYQAGLDAQTIKFTPDGKYMLAASRTAVGVVDVAAGKILFYRDINASGSIDLSPDGTRLLVHSGDTIEVLDATTGETQKTIKVEQSGNSYWAGNKHILVGEHALLDVEAEFVSWNYTGQLATFSAGGQLWFLAKDEQSAILRSEQLPHPVALAKIEEAQRDPDFFLLKPGSTVNVDVQVPTDPEKIKAALILKLESSGFQYDPNSSSTFVATKRAGKTEEISVRDFGSFGFEGEKYNFTPQIVSLELREGDQSLWHRAQHGYVPGIFDIRQGETKETALRRYEDPGLGFYERVVFPKFIVRPGKAGETKITTSPLQ